MRQAVRHPAGTLALIVVAAVSSGCASTRLTKARSNFYGGRFAEAEASLATLPPGNTDRVLALMERGMVKQSRSNYSGSIADWLAAVELADRLDYYSVSRGTSSFAINDRVMAYRGAPYERTLLRAFTAKSYLALSRWDDAAVEARNMIHDLEHLDGFPDSPYCRYLAACCLELQGDTEGAAYQYALVAEQLPHLAIDPLTGRFGETATGQKPGDEWICFVLIGRAPSGAEAWDGGERPGPAPYAEFHGNGKLLGRSYNLDTTGRLMALTNRKLAAMRAVKTAARIAAKEAAAQALSHENQLLGDLLRLLLFSLEQPDTRAWETLPYWLQVARFPYDPTVRNVNVQFKSSGGLTLEELPLSGHVKGRHATMVSFCRQMGY